MKFNKLLTGVLIFVLGAAFLFLIKPSFMNTNQENSQKIVRIGYTPLIYAQPTYVAVEMEFFKKNSLRYKMVKYENSTQALNALIANKLDFLAVVPVASVFAAESRSTQKTPLFKILYYNLDSPKNPISFLMVKSARNIDTLEDLKSIQNLKVGVFPGNLLSILSTKLLFEKHKDLDIKPTFIDVAPQLQAQTLISGGVDVMMTLEPFATILESKKIAKVIYTAPQTSITNPLAGGAGVFSSKFIQDYPNLSKSFALSINEAIDYIRKNPQAAKKSYLKYTPLDLKIALQVRQPDYHVGSEVSKVLLKEQYQQLKKNKVLATDKAVDLMVYDDGQ
jgi:ABC-type nitrate/sulfonate/bicarbonate transport system substrate-binding protein